MGSATPIRGFWSTSRMSVDRHAKTTPKMRALIVTRAQQGWAYARFAAALSPLLQPRASTHEPRTAFTVNAFPTRTLNGKGRLPAERGCRRVTGRGRAPMDHTTWRAPRRPALTSEPVLFRQGCFADRPGRCLLCATRSTTRSSRRMRNSLAMRWISPSSAIEMLSSVADTANRHRISVSFCS